MATRTLGIKFEIAGIKEAQAGLKRFRQNLNQSLAENKQALNQIVKFDSKLPKPLFNAKNNKQEIKLTQEVVVPKKATQQSNNLKNQYRQQGRIIAEQIKFVLADNNEDFIASYQKAFAKIKQGDVKGGVGEWLKQPINSIFAGYYEAIGGEFGSLVGQRLLGVRESNVSSFKNHTTNYGNSNRILVDINPQQFKSFAETLHSRFSKNENFNQLNVKVETAESQNKPSLLERASEPITGRIEAVSSGYFEGIGNFFGEEFASGLAEVLEEELDYSQKRKGRITGKSISFVANDGLENLNEKFDTLKYVIADLGDETEKVNLDKLKKFIAALIGIPNSLVDSYLTGFRRASVQEEGTIKVGKNKAKFNEDIDNVEDYENVIVTVAGFAGKQGKQGRAQAERLRELNTDDKTVVLSSDTPFTDVLVDAKDTATGAVWGVNALANSAKINLKGFNPDAVELVNKILALREKNPALKIKLVGHSAGGFVAEEAQYLAELLGIKGIKTVSVGTPNLKGGLKPEKIERIFAENDPLEALHKIAEIVDFKESSTNYDDVPEGHSFEQYLASDKVRQAIFGSNYNNTQPNVQEPEAVDDLTREVIYTVGDAIATALETEGSPEAKAEAAKAVILEAVAEYDAKVRTAIDEQIGEAQEVTVQTAEELQTLIENPQLFSEQQAKKLYNLIEAKLGQFFDVALQLIAEGVDFGLRSYRRNALYDVGRSQVYNRAQEILAQNRSRTGARVTEEHQQFFAVTGGYAGARGLSGDRIARRLRGQVDNAYVIHVPNRNSDVPASAIENPEERPAAWARTLGTPNLRGYSPDAIEIAAQALAAHLRNPEIEIKIIGESGGGYAAEEAVHLLNLLNVPNVSGIGVGNPNLIGGIRARNFTRLLSPDEPVGREARDLWARYHLADLSAPSQNIPGIAGHPYEYYENTAQLQDFIHGQPGKTSRGRGRRIKDISEQFLAAGTEDLTPAQRDDLATAARNNLTIIQRRIPQATGESLRYLQEAESNFQAFFQLLQPGSERLENYRSLLQRARREIDRRKQTPNRQNLDYLQGIGEDIQNYRQQYANLAQTDDRNQFQVIDRELAKLQTDISEFIQATLARPRTQLKQRYRRYLQNKRNFSQEQLGEFVFERRADYQNLSPTDKGNYVEQIQSSLRSRVQDYRQSINTGDLTLAKNIANSILAQVELIKQVYRDIAQSLPDNDTLKNSIRGNQAYLSSVQTEIVSGSNAPGRINKGLPDILEEQIELAQSGRDAASGFIEGILGELDRVAQAGSDLGQTVQDATDENIERNSPAVEFIKKGIDVAKGLIIGIRSQFADVRDTGEELGEQLTIDVDALPEPNLLNSIKSWFNQIENRFPLIKKYKGAIATIAGLFLGGMGINYVVSALGRFSQEILATAMAVESFERAIIFSSRNFFEGIDNLNFVSQTAKNLKVDLNQAKEAYAGLISAAKNTPLEGEQIKRVFTAFAESASNRGVNVQGQQRLFTALEQIIGKRKLQREEVKGQIGDIRGFGDFQNLIAQAQGISTSQLEEQMQRGQIGLDVLPKVAAILEAQNAASSSIQTAVQAQTKYNNALTEFKTLVGGMLQPFQKFIYNLLGDGLEFLTARFKAFGRILLNLTGVILLGLIVNFRIIPVLISGIRIALVGLVNALQSLWAVLPTLLPILLQFVAAYALVATAIATVGNLIKLSKNQYQKLNDDVEKLTDSMLRYSTAVGEAASNQSKLGNAKPQLNEGVKLPKWLQGIAGGERLNLDNLVRKRINITTEAEKRQADFQVASGDFQFRANQLLTNSQPAIGAAEEIAKFDEQIRAVQSKRLEILPGDKSALEESLAQERAISEERDKQLKILTNYQQSLQSSLTLNQKFLDQLEIRYAKGEISPEVYQSQRAGLEGIQEDTKDKLEGVNNIISKVSKTLSEFQRELRNSSERIKGFIENRQRQTQQERVKTISEGIANQEGERVIQLKLDKINRRELQDNIREIEKAIANSFERLQSGALAEGYNLVQRSAEENDLPLTSTTIERMLQEERSSSEKDALGELKQLRELEGQLYQNQEQLAQNLQQNRTTLIDFNRTISDYFFRLAQEIKEAQVEVKRLINQLFYGDIKSKLKSAIAPGSESFLNGIIEGIQGVIDQAASIAEKVLGQDSALIGFETKQYDLQTQLQDFARQIAGASDAVTKFIRSLGEGTGTRGSGDGENSFAEGQSVAKKALSWQGKHFKKGVYAMCAGFVRQILGEAGVNVGITKNPYDAGKQPNNGELMARSFFGSDVGTVFKNASQAKPGDIIGFFDTYQYGQKPGAITHVGVYTGNNMMVDRSTSSKPVNHRSIDTFGKGNYIFVRPHQYQTLRENGASTPTTVNKDNYSTSFTQGNNILQQARELKDQRLNIEADRINWQDLGINFDRQNLGIDIEQQQGRNTRTFETQARERDRAAQQLRDRVSNLGLENQLPTAEGELEKNLINVRSQFRDFDNEIYQQLQRLTDFVRTAQRFIDRAPEAIAQLRARGTDADVEAANLITDTLKQTSDELPGYLELIKEIAGTQENLPQAQAEAIKFIEEQGRLKIQQQELNKQSLISQLKLNIATLRGTNAERKQLEIAAEKLRLEQRINEIRQQYGNTDYADELIKTERENSQVNLTKIDNEAVNRELNLEQQLINLQSDKAGKKAGLLKFIGLDLEANKLQREAAVNSEMVRYKQQIEQLKQSYAGEPEKLDRLLKNAKELNQLNLDNIKLQFKSLGTQLQELSFKNLQGFFSNLFTLFTTGGERQQQILQANLDYAQKLNSASDKFKRNPAELAQAKNRLKELNNQKLDGIRNEFNLFNRVVNFAKQAISEFLKSFAQMMARRAAAGIFKSIGLGLGFADGGTVPNFAEGGTIADKQNRIVPSYLSSHLKSSSLPIRQAFNREGSKGVLAVFTPGEEILSLRTGEAQRYQSLKQELGNNPLQSIFAGNFSNGGTIEGNLLNNISTRPSSVRFDGSSLNRGTTNNINRTGTVNINVTTPDADSFRMSEHQLGLDAAESLRRSMKR